MGGKRELELETRKCLLYCLHVKLTTQKTFFPTAETLVFSCIYYYYYDRQSHFLSHYESLNVSHILPFSLSRKWRHFTYTVFFSNSQLLLSPCFIVSTSAPLLAPTITNTDMYVYILMFFRLYHFLADP